MTSPSPLRCSCGTLIDVSEIPEVESILCPSCGKTVQAFPHEALPHAPSTPPPLPPTLSQKILQTLLDPRSIQWMLMIGGGLSVLGLLIYLVSIGLFDNPIYAATALGLGSIALLASGWGVVIRTHYRTAGQALTFLACVILPLNLWFYDAQGLLLVENNLWLAGLACCTLYVATVYVLRDPMFLYAVEAGITLTVMLFLGHRGWVGHLSAWSVASLVLGVSSLLLETAFPTREDETFSRKRFGKPLFHSGLLQLIASVSILLLVQCVSWFTPPGYSLLDYDWSAGELVRHSWFAAGLWLVAACAWIFAEWQHRSKGLYTSLGISSLVLAEVTLVAGLLYYEGAIAVMTATALMFHLWLVVQQGTDSKPEMDRNIEHRNNSWLGFGLLAIPFSLGFLLQIRSLAPIRLPEHMFYQTGNYYVPVMLLLWGTALTAVFSNKHLSKIWSTAYHLLASATFLLAASEYLRDLGYGIWSIQGVALIPVAILYLPASRIWRGTKHEQSLKLSGHAALLTVVCLVFVAALIRQPQAFLPLAGSRDTLLLGILSLEIAAFYFLARLLSRQAVHLYLATGFVAAAIWQYLCYSGIAPTYYAPIFSLLGGILIVSARIRGIHEVTEQIKPDTQRTLCRGPGLTLFQCGNAVLLFAIASTILQGLARLLVDRVDYSSLIAVGATILVNLLVVIAAPNLNWRRAYLSTVA